MNAAQGNNGGTDLADNDTPKFEQVKRFVRKSLPSGRMLQGELFADADEIEVTATDPRNGAVLDRTATIRVPNLKRFVRRNPEKTFILRVRAGATLAQKVRLILGREDRYVPASPGQTITLRELNLDLISRDITFVASGEVYAWEGVTILWPRDAAGRSTVRGGLLVLDSAP
jgi:hypothetical protein